MEIYSNVNLISIIMKPPNLKPTDVLDLSDRRVQMHSCRSFCKNSKHCREICSLCSLLCLMGSCPGHQHECVCVFVCECICVTITAHRKYECVLCD